MRGQGERPVRVLVAGWPSFVDGEATAGDVLAMRAVRQALEAAGIECELAWSPVFRPGALTLGEAVPGRYSHLVFCCGPLHGAQVEELHRRYAHCRRIAVGVSVTDAADPAVSGFHKVLARDAPGSQPRRDLAAEVSTQPVPVAGVVLAPGQPEYGRQGRHDRATESLGRWLGCRECGWVPLDTRLDAGGWPDHAMPDQVEAIVRRLDVVVTSRLHGLVLALKNGIPALAVDPVAGGAKVAAQARAWDWPAVVIATDDGLDKAELDQHWQWCLSPEGASQAKLASGGGAPLTADLVRALTPA
jgi:Polysaccharide pyruvyl transferase